MFFRAQIVEHSGGNAPPYPFDAIKDFYMQIRVHLPNEHHSIVLKMIHLSLEGVCFEVKIGQVKVTGMIKLT